MRIHSNTLTVQTIRAALNSEIKAGRIARSVGFKTLTEHKSQSHGAAFEVQLESWEKLDGDGRRYGNSGAYGGGSEYAATYDEWGFLLNAVFELDEHAVCGSVKNPVYADRADFDFRTGISYHPSLLLHFVGDLDEDAYDPFPYVGAKNNAGRRGAGRVHVDASTSMIRYCKEQPRDEAWVRSFARLDAAVSA